MEGHEPLAVPSVFNFGDIVDGWAAVAPDHEALIAIDQLGTTARWTYGQMAAGSSEIAQKLDSIGVTYGDRVIVMLPRGAHWQLTMVGCLKLGAIPVPCITMLTSDDVAYRVRDCGASCVVTTAEHAAKFADTNLPLRLIASGAAPQGWCSLDELHGAERHRTNARVAADDPAVIYYTSGSTGSPKGATLASRNLYMWRIAAEHWLGLAPRDRIWCTADTGWSKAGCSTLFGPWTCGSTVVVFDGPFEPRQRLEILQRVGVSVYCAPATELRRVLSEQLEAFDLSTLRLTASAGESVSPDLFNEWTMRTGVPLLEGYGQTENLMTVANRLDQPIKPGSMGTPLPGVEIAVVTDDNRIQHHSAVGQLALRCPTPHMMLGYWGDPAKTAAAQRHLDGATWFLTGDMTTIDDDGYVTFVGRMDDLIGSSGYRIGPQEVENALLSHPAVVDVAVVGCPDAIRGEAVKAFVVLDRDRLPSDELVAELQSHA